MSMMLLTVVVVAVVSDTSPNRDLKSLKIGEITNRRRIVTSLDMCELTKICDVIGFARTHEDWRHHWKFVNSQRFLPPYTLQRCSSAETWHNRATEPTTTNNHNNKHDDDDQQHVTKNEEWTASFIPRWQPPAVNATYPTQ